MKSLHTKVVNLPPKRLLYPGNISEWMQMEEGCEWKHFRNPVVAGAIAKITKQTLPTASGERGDQDRGRRFQLRPTSVVTKTEADAPSCIQRAW